MEKARGRPFQKGHKVNLGRKNKPQQGFQKGHKGFVSKEGYEKIAKKRRGLHFSLEWKNKISLANKGQVAWSKDKTLTEEQKRPRIEGLKRYWDKKGRVTSENKRIRRSLEFRLWRKSVFDRDDYTCQHCKKRGAELHPDHIKPFALFPELRFDINNGRTLCKTCHMETPTWGVNGKKYTREMFESICLQKDISITQS